jgi:NH3-dependent NAD+ synthetase
LVSSISPSWIKDDVRSRHHIIGFSGGIDSSVVAALIRQEHQNLQDQQHYYIMGAEGGQTFGIAPFG